MKLARFTRPDAWSWSGFDQLSTLRNEINRLFEGSDGNSTDAFNSWAPAMDLYEENDKLTLTVEVPGLKKEDIEISLHENTITISGERRNEKKYGEADVSREERFFGRFTRSLVLPKPVNPEGVKARCQDGLLIVTLPKSEEAKPRQIEIQPS